MKNKYSKIIFVFIFFCVYSLSKAQTIEDIKRKSDNNKNDRTNSSSSSSDLPISPAVATSCLNNMNVCLPLMNYLFTGIGSIQKLFLEAENDVPDISSIQIQMEAGLNPKADLYLLRPRIKGNWGLFGTDFRGFYLYQENAKGFSNYSTYDWQVLMLNLSALKEFKLRTGVGFMYEEFNKTFTAEYTFNTEIVPSDIFKFNAEYRLARDGKTRFNSRQEFNTGVDFTVLNTEHFITYAGPHVSYNKIYDTEFWSFGAGLSFKIQ